MSKVIMASKKRIPYPIDCQYCEAKNIPFEKIRDMVSTTPDVDKRIYFIFSAFCQRCGNEYLCNGINEKVEIARNTLVYRKSISDTIIPNVKVIESIKPEKKDE